MSKKKTVLIVEDEDILRDLLQTMLEENGFTVIAAVDGEEAVETFQKHKDEIGVILSDLGLPKLGGWDAFLKMREIEPTLKGILASGYFEETVKAEIIKSGANNFIQKPYNPPEIVAMLRELLEKQE
jgi:two-component system cell cycle sensor histidine kinase/response regulator CckA